jgi:hypothetical protein
MSVLEVGVHRTGIARIRKVEAAKPRDAEAIASAQHDLALDDLLAEAGEALDLLLAAAPAELQAEHDQVLAAGGALVLSLPLAGSVGPFLALSPVTGEPKLVAGPHRFPRALLAALAQAAGPLATSLLNLHAAPARKRLAAAFEAAAAADLAVMRSAAGWELILTVSIGGQRIVAGRVVVPAPEQGAPAAQRPTDAA